MLGGCEKGLRGQAEPEVPRGPRCRPPRVRNERDPKLTPLLSIKCFFLHENMETRAVKYLIMQRELFYSWLLIYYIMLQFV